MRMIFSEQRMKSIEKHLILNIYKMTQVYLFIFTVHNIQNNKSWYMYNSALQRLPTEMPCNGPQLSNYHSFIAYSKTKQFIRFIYQTKQAYCNFWLFFHTLVLTSSVFLSVLQITSITFDCDRLGFLTHFSC